MDGFSIEQRQRIITALQKAHANEPCPRCRHKEFTLVDGYVQISTRPSLEVAAFIIGGPTIPTVLTICTRCGFVAQHAIGALNLLPQEVKQNAGQAN